MAPQDSFIDEDDECWYVPLPFKLGSHLTAPSEDLANRLPSPLCVEEFDLSDKNFRPCPCGYQVSIYNPQI